MKKTKIVCSIGPASNEPDVMEKMVRAGMNVARINFSHATLFFGILKVQSLDVELWKMILLNLFQVKLLI